MTVITLCRFNDNKELERETKDYELSETEYWAVSHMWCDATWLNIPGIPSEVLASPQKARFIQSRLPQIVGTEPFWMDILSVDQSDSASKRAVVRNIPEIYSNAHVTLIIRECGGFDNCCDRLLLSADPAQGTFGVMPQVDALAVRDHILVHHRTNLHEYWLQRLWPLQELHLSRTILFATCETDDPAQRNVPETEGFILRAERETNMLLDLAASWAGLDDVDSARVDLELNHWRIEDQMARQRRALRSEFIRALLSNGRVSKIRLTPNVQGEADPAIILQASQTSQRQTGRARDFVFAIFPRFPWYSTPDISVVVGNDFRSVFEDCNRQIREEDTISEDLRILLRPKLTKGMQDGFDTTAELSFHALRDVPTPRTLGEFTNLFCLESLTYGPVQFDELEDIFEPRWQVRHVNSEDGLELILEAIASTAMFTRPSNTEDFGEGPHPTGDIESAGLDRIDDNSILTSLEYRVAYIVWYKLRQIHNLIYNVDVPTENDELSLERTWTWIWDLIRHHDSPRQRTVLLYLPTAHALNFSVETTPYFLESRMTTYLLLGRHPRNGNVVFETLVLGAEGIEASGVRSLLAYEEENYPYLTAYGLGDSVQRIIGLLPHPDFPPTALVHLSRGFPKICRKEDEFTPGNTVIKDTYF